MSHLTCDVHFQEGRVQVPLLTLTSEKIDNISNKSTILVLLITDGRIGHSNVVYDYNDTLLIRQGHQKPSTTIHSLVKSQSTHSIRGHVMTYVFNLMFLVLICHNHSI